jgi:hypothetical protein
MAPKAIELGIIALLQANTQLYLQATIPMPRHFHDKTGTRRDYGKGDDPNIYFGLVIKAEVMLRHSPGQIQISDISSGKQSYRTDVGGLSLVGFVQTSWIDPKFVLLDNNPNCISMR